MRKIIALVLLLCLTAALFASCGNGTADPAETQKPGQGQETGTAESQPESDRPSETETDAPARDYIADGLRDEDFNKFVFNIMYSPARGLMVINLEDAQTGDLIEDTLYECSSAVAERFNILYERTDGGDDHGLADKLEASVLSGTKNEFAMTIGHDYLSVRNSMKGYYADLTESDAFDFSKPWWPEKNLQSTSIGGRMYVASSYVSYSPMTGAGILAFNKKMMADRNLEAPYEEAFDRDWYMEDLIQYAARGHNDADADGTIDIDAGEQYGFVMGSMAATGFERSMDVVPVGKDSEDMPEYALDAERAYTMLELLGRLLESGKRFDENNSQFEAFKNNGALFLYTSTRDVYRKVRTYVDVTYGFLPVPMLDESQTDYIAGASDMLWGVPQTSVDQFHQISTIIEALSCQCYNYVVPAFYETTLQTKLSDAEEDIKVLDIVRDATAMPFAYFFGTALGGLDIAMAELPRQTTASGLSSYIAAREATLIRNIAQLIDDFYAIEELQNHA
ncbi:MAG: hypothetical protein IKS35_02120 [Clostridia bacterium]|nr:hypothetical protein [Clostridia bacterium]